MKLLAMVHLLRFNALPSNSSNHTNCHFGSRNGKSGGRGVVGFTDGEPYKYSYVNRALLCAAILDTSIALAKLSNAFKLYIPGDNTIGCSVFFPASDEVGYK